MNLDLISFEELIISILWDLKFIWHELSWWLSSSDKNFIQTSIYSAIQKQTCYILYCQQYEWWACFKYSYKFLIGFLQLKTNFDVNGSGIEHLSYSYESVTKYSKCSIRSVNFTLFWIPFVNHETFELWYIHYFVPAFVAYESLWPKLWIIWRIHSMRFLMNGLTRGVWLISLVVVWMSDHAEDFELDLCKHAAVA